ncbi:MAG TPA: redox-regulated ATPase YchF [Bacteroidota bacterium]|mgnify:CR=1 FL=1|nr:redox-regulated ATPase YchF [Bacteroidota bacterium]
MGFTCGIIGLPNVGKSTLFNALTSAGAAVANYPFCTIDPNVGVVNVPDQRLARMAQIYHTEKIIPTTLEFLDIAGLVKGASTGEGLGNQFLSHIRMVDAIAHVVRCFEDENIVHVDGAINPQYDIEIVETELILKDLETIEKKIKDVEKRIRTGDKKVKAEADFYEALKQHLSSGRLARYYQLTHEDEKQYLHELHLLTSKPVMYVCNVHERDLLHENSYVESVRRVAEREGAKVVVVCAAVEAEIAELPESERADFLKGLNLQESGLSKVIREGYNLLQLITFFTAGPKEVHAWTIHRGATAPEAAGEIHSDFQKGFIRAEIIKYADLDRLGSETAVKEAGLLHIEGHEYVMEDGDIMVVRFNV